MARPGQLWPNTAKLPTKSHTMRSACHSVGVNLYCNYTVSALPAVDRRPPVGYRYCSGGPRSA